MSFEKVSFLSYRHRPAAEYLTTIREFHETLEGELLMYNIDLRSYWEEDRVAEDFVNSDLASTLCKSVCMVVLYIPPYFDPKYMTCAREYKAMETLEKQRMEKLGHTNKKTHGLIIPVVYRGWEDFPDAIKTERTCYNIQPYTLGKRIGNSVKAKVEISKIAQYISARYRELQTIDHPCSICTQFRYPDESRVAPWFATLQAPRQGGGLPMR